MKFSKKLLTALLPIAATGAIVPAVTSCNKGNGYVINFGDEVNCLVETDKNYHSLNDVKNSIKQRVSIEQTKTIQFAKLPIWSQSQTYKQMLYFDLIASLSIINETKFHLTYTSGSEENTLVCKYLDKDGKEQTANGANVMYAPDTTKPTQVDILLGVGTGSIKIKSYAFQNTEIV